MFNTNALCGILSPINMHYKQSVRNAAGVRQASHKKTWLPLSRIITLYTHTHTLLKIRAQAFAQNFSLAATIHGVMNVCALTSQHSSSAEALKSAVCWLYIWSAINYGALK